MFKKIKDNPEKCLFNDYERLINLIFSYCEENKVIIEPNKIIKDINVDNLKNELIPIGKNINNLLKMIIELFENIKNTTGIKIINSFLSIWERIVFICSFILL